MEFIYLITWCSSNFLHKIMAFRYGQNYISTKKTIRSLFELIQVLTQIVNHPYLVSYRVITK